MMRERELEAALELGAKLGEMKATAEEAVRELQRLRAEVITLRADLEALHKDHHATMQRLLVVAQEREDLLRRLMQEHTSVTGHKAGEPRDEVCLTCAEIDLFLARRTTP